MTSGRVESNDVPYNLLNRTRTTEYAMHDILWTMEIYLQCRPAITARQNEEALRREEEIIPALVRMESCGFQIDVDYVHQITHDLSEYLQQQRTKLYNLIGEHINIGQHAKIKEILSDL